MLKAATTTFVCLAVAALAPRAAAADPVGLELHAGGAFKVITTEQCSSGAGWTCVGGRTHTIVGAAPMGGIGLIKRTTRKRGWQFRFGPEVMASAIGDHNERGVTLGAVMKAGFHFHWLHAELGYGVSAVSFRAATVENRSLAGLIHYAAGFDLGERWALRGKIDGHLGASDGITAVVVGLGLVFTP